MGRDTGPINKISRRLSTMDYSGTPKIQTFSILENEKEFLKGKKREYGPGMHGQKRKRRPSAYGKQLIEKQKLRHLYQIREKQLKNLFIKSSKKPGVTSLQILIALEKRLDNVVFRLGFTSTRRQARQLVNHGHVLVNDKKIDIPSYEISIQDVISLSKKAKNFAFIKESMEIKKVLPAYLERDDAAFSGKMIRDPERGELNENINEALIIEYYNRLL